MALQTLLGPYFLLSAPAAAFACRLLQVLGIREMIKQYHFTWTSALKPVKHLCVSKHSVPRLVGTTWNRT